MIEKNVSEEAKNSLEMQQVIDEMPERIKISIDNKKMQDFINWYIGTKYDECKDMSIDDLILFLLRSKGHELYLEQLNSDAKEAEQDMIIDALVDGGLLAYVDDEDGIGHLSRVDKK